MFCEKGSAMAAEREKISKMDRHKKIEYICMYYKIPIILVCVFAAAVFGSVWHVLFNNQKTVYNFAVINEKMDVSRDKAMMGMLTQYWNLPPRKEKVVVDSNYNIPFLYDEKTQQAINQDGSPASDFSTYEKFFLNMSAGVIDAAVMPEGFMEYCNGLDIYFCDLRDIFPGEFLETFKDRFCYGTDLNGTVYLCGLYMEETVFDAACFAVRDGKNLADLYGRQILAFPKTQKNGIQNESFVTFLFEKYRVES